MKENLEQNPPEQNPHSLRSSPLDRGASPKIAILHDAFLYRGGGERLISLMAQAIGADLISGFFSDGSFDPRELGYTGNIISLGKPVFAKGLRHMVLKWRFFWQASILREYDIVIFSGDCLGAMRHVRSDARQIYYCHTPPRYLYDFRSKYLLGLPFFIRPIFRMIFSFFARVYEQHIAGFDQIISNSQNVHDRLLAYCGHESEIIYPPTDTTFFTPGISILPTDSPFPVGEYFYSWARLSPPKRVDLIIEAFVQMPDQHLVFSYGKNDPMRVELLQKIQGYQNIHAIEAPDDALLLSLIRGATATIYIPVDEDFGMSPVESMACGTPVIGVDEGGLRETIIEGETGKLIQIVNGKSGIQNLKQVIQNTKKEEWEGMQDACVARAGDFSLDSFARKIQSLIYP